MSSLIFTADGRLINSNEKSCQQPAPRVEVKKKLSSSCMWGLDFGECPAKPGSDLGCDCNKQLLDFYNITPYKSISDLPLC